MTPVSDGSITSLDVLDRELEQKADSRAKRPRISTEEELKLEPKKELE